MRVLAILAAVSGFLCVAIGAFGAHALSDARAQALIDTGVLYQMFHTAAALALMALLGARARTAAMLFLGGAAVFSGSLYAMALGAPPLMGAITPLGGLAFLAGWIAALVAFARHRIGAP